MKLDTYINSLYEENTYFLYNGTNLLVIDPGSDFKEIVAKIEYYHPENIAIYLTHSHYDHILSCPRLVDKYKCNIYTHTSELVLLADPLLNLSIHVNQNLVISNAIGVEDIFNLLGFNINVYHVPGHTAGHSMLEVKELKALITGDFIFKEEIGRCDFPTGDFKAMVKSLALIKSMNPKFEIFPGHGPKTTLEHEIKYNGYLKRA